MGLFITSLNSGSNGNCYYLGNDSEAVLVDVGISCREVETRMKRLGLEIGRVKAIFISHEHTDHIKGLELLSRKHQVPVYITHATRRQGRVKLEKHLSFSFGPGETVQVGSLSITAFSKLHDAVDPFSFMVSGNGVNIGVFTDIGKACANVIHHFRQCHAAILESNYDEQMLANGRYPYYLKKRISGGQGHLSNTEALELFRQHRAPFLSHLFLGHLSQHNNHPQLVQELFEAHADGVRMVIAPRTGETPLYRITPAGTIGQYAGTIAPPTQQLQLQFV